ncbi:MAG: DUF1566 domain-containing protein [candidate division Zixibacteria bacterium]|nr:DUF1566 domain-containing protein [candidate division Zixibacteria bacterium]
MLGSIIDLRKALSDSTGRLRSALIDSTGSLRTAFNDSIENLRETDLHDSIVQIRNGLGISMIDLLTNLNDSIDSVHVELDTSIIDLHRALHDSIAQIRSEMPPVTELSIGEFYGGGIIFWVDASEKHGLIADTVDLNSAKWGPQWNQTGATANGVYAGISNTDSIIANQSPNNFAAELCADYGITRNNVYYDDWYLPSKAELTLLYNAEASLGDYKLPPHTETYWSSTEETSSKAYQFSNGQFGTSTKNLEYNVRAIRAF